MISEFHCYFRDGRVYAPKEIKESYVRFLWAILGISKEIGCLDNQKLEYQKLLEIIMNAKMREELMEVSEYLLSIIKETKVVEDTTHLTVKRVISLIQEFYMTGITLDEIGSKLHITPEYLGTQFHKEMGITFSTYLKNFRINRAKELLCGTQLKLYEIADRVGYSDSKYFSKVFRDTTGQLPAEYRKTYK